MRDAVLLPVVLAGVLLAGCAAGGGDEVVQPDPRVVEEGERWPLNLTAEEGVERVTGRVTLTNEGEDSSVTSVGLVSPEHTLTFREVTLGAGGTEDVTVEHAFNETAGPAGQYRLVVYAEVGAVTVTDARLEVDLP